jgi:hypothetical protein
MPLALALLALAALVLLVPGVGALEFHEEPTAITDDMSGVQGNVVMSAGPEDLLYAVWEDGRYVQSSRGIALLFAFSDVDARGRNWSDIEPIPPMDLKNDMTTPDIDVGPDGVIHIVWQELDRSGDTTGGPFWEVRYASSLDGFDWERIGVSPPNNRNNTRPSVVALPGRSAYVAWEMEDHPGTSVALALIDQGSRAWIREDFADASDRWELNGHTHLDIDSDGSLHAVWESRDMDGMWDLLESQVMYRVVPDPDRTSPLPAAVLLADEGTGVINSGPSLATTRRHGTWVTWVQRSNTSMVGNNVAFMADRVQDGQGSEDIMVATLAIAPGPGPAVHAMTGPDDTVHLAISGVGQVVSPPVYTATCSEQGCFAEAKAVVPQGTTRGYNASVAIDSLGNVYIGWDDGKRVWSTQSSNSPPGAPELLRPDGSTNEAKVEFEWSFSDPDAGAYQGAFHIQYSMDMTFPAEGTLGGVVLGAQGRSGSYVAPDPLDEGRWWWKVSTRDELGLWSSFSSTEDFLVDRTPPAGSLVINGGDEFTKQRVVVLTLNASDNLDHFPGDMYFQISSDPNFPNASKHEWPPPNDQVNQELPPGEGVKVVFFRIFDASGLYHTSMDTIIYNETALLIIHTPVTTAPSGKPLNISCEIMRATGVTTSLFYRRVDADSWKEVEMEVNGTLYWAFIPKETMTVRGVEYYIKARSPLGSVTSPIESPAEEPYPVEVYETTDVYRPPIYNPLVTFTGALAVLVVLFMLWYYRLREQKD